MPKHAKEVKLWKTWQFWDRILLVFGLPLVVLFTLLAIRYHFFPFGP
jgi:hypothetical protein